ncbi:SDR family NAD(P)-dependent oxidoreductase [Hymenobacter sp. BT491]|uniref:SDR family NAD(P)-dependent oxidoreductase n=1 Tax=Hymenobacter sp. BT491 TaxID=2766779 RepID=UPI001653BD69|nr:SDR family oxidoreductase [Hymenobacter sp. BT491]MBC6992000.1 SDR family oxidoreductase [Hymenobacter sp. BT491]
MSLSLSPLSGRVAVVTGGAGGIGSAICQTLAAAGASVVITYNTNADKAETLLAQLPGTGHAVFQAPVDNSQTLKQLSDFVTERYGRLDMLINNAGITTPVPHDDLEGLSDEWIDRIFTTNWRGAFAMIRACQGLLTASGNGLVVNISSVAGQTGIGSNVAYCASKAALDSMTRSLARALAPAIRVVSVSPGWVLGEYASRADPAYLQAQVEATPLGRLATPGDVANAVLALATTLTFTTGSILPVDGGRPLR